MPSTTLTHPPPPPFPAPPPLPDSPSLANSLSSFRSDYSAAEAVSAASLDALLATAGDRRGRDDRGAGVPEEEDLESDSSDGDASEAVEEDADGVVTHWTRPYAEELTMSGNPVFEGDLQEVMVEEEEGEEERYRNPGGEDDARAGSARKDRQRHIQALSSPRRHGRLPPQTPHAGFTTPVVVAPCEGEGDAEDDGAEGGDCDAVVVHDVSFLLNTAAASDDDDDDDDHGSGDEDEDDDQDVVDVESVGRGERGISVVHAAGTSVLEPEEEARFVSGGREMFARSRNEAMIWGSRRSSDAWAVAVAAPAQQRDHLPIVGAHRGGKAGRVRGGVDSRGRRRGGGGGGAGGAELVSVTTTTTTTLVAVAGDAVGDMGGVGRGKAVLQAYSGGASNASSFSTASGGLDGEGEVVVRSAGGRSDDELTTTTVTPPPSSGSGARWRRKSSSAKPRPAAKAAEDVVDDGESALVVFVPPDRVNGTRGRPRSIARESESRAGEVGRARAVRGLTVLLSRIVNDGLRHYAKLIKAVGCSLEGETPSVTHAREALASAYKIADKEEQFVKTPRQKPRPFPPVDERVVAWGGKALKDRKGKGEVLFGSAFGFGGTVAIVAALMSMEGFVVSRGPVRMGAEARLGASMEVEIGATSSKGSGKVTTVAIVAARADGTGVDVRMRCLGDSRLTLNKTKRRKAFLARVATMEAAWKCVGLSAGLTSKQKAAAALLSAAKARAAVARGIVGGAEHFAIQAAGVGKK